MKPILFLICIIVLGIIIYIYIKRKEKNKQQECHQRTTIDVNTIHEDKRHEDFIKSINIVHQERTIIGTIYVNGKEEELSVQKEENGYIYFLGDTVIGGYNPKIMGDNVIIFRENTLENQLSDQIKDQIVQVIEKTKKRKEQEKERESIHERTRNRNVYEQQMGYQKSIGKEGKQESIGQERRKEKIQQVEEMQKRREQVEKVKEYEREKQIIGKQQKIQNTVKDINIKQEVDMNTMATDMDTIGKRLEEAGKIKG